MTREKGNTCVEVSKKTRDRLIRMKYDGSFRNLDDVVKDLLKRHSKY